MSRIKEAFAFKTDEERLTWFDSLTPDEQAQVVSDVRCLFDSLTRIIKPLFENLAEWSREAMPILTELGSQIEAILDEGES